MTVRDVLRSTALVIATSLAASATASAQGLNKLEIVGGNGGTPFEYVCGPGRVLFGVRGYAGVWLDNLQTVCGKVEADNISDAQPEGPVFGGARPLDKIAYCVSGTAVAGMEIDPNKDNGFVGSIRVRCAELRTSYTVEHSPTIRGSGRLSSERGNSIGAEFTTTPARQECPGGGIAVGIHGRAGQFLDAVGLICGPKPGPSAAPATVAFQSMNYPDRYIRHRGWQAYIDPRNDDLARKDSSFRVVPGLAGRCSSFESVNFPDHFLRHQGSRIKLAKRTNDALFYNDATFCVAAGLAGSGSSLESINYPNHYVRHMHSELWLHPREDTELFRKDGTFNLVAAEGRPGRRIGRAKLETPPPTERETPSTPPPPAAPVPPYITATPAVVAIPPGQTGGRTTLAWDAGKGHEYAEVWVKVDNADETFVVEQGKGTREVRIERGKTYLFILTENNRRLATVTVTTN